MGRKNVRRIASSIVIGLYFFTALSHASAVGAFHSVSGAGSGMYATSDEERIQGMFDSREEMVSSW